MISSDILCTTLCSDSALDLTVPYFDETDAPRSAVLAILMKDLNMDQVHVFNCLHAYAYSKASRGECVMSKEAAKQQANTVILREPVSRVTAQLKVSRYELTVLPNLKPF